MSAGTPAGSAHMYPEETDIHEDLRNSGNTDSIDSIAPPNQYSDLQDINISKGVFEIGIPAKSPGFIMAAKTNMLYDAALVPNIGAEFYLGKDLSVTGEWMYAWWDSYNRHRYWRVYGGDLGLRWWFGRKAHEKPLTGHHLGIFAGALTFDFELGDYGYMGGKPGGTLWDRCLVHSGIEYGYSLPITRRLNIDFSIALGFLGGNYIKYFPFDNEYFKQKEYKMRFVGPTKAEVSLVWLIGRGNANNRKGGAE